MLSDQFFSMTKGKTEIEFSSFDSLNILSSVVIKYYLSSGLPRKNVMDFGILRRMLEKTYKCIRTYFVNYVLV